jgi:hypothetical protein
VADALRTNPGIKVFKTAKALLESEEFEDALGDIDEIDAEHEHANVDADSGRRRKGFRGERENDSGAKANSDSGLKANSDSGGKANGFRSSPESCSRSPECFR